MWELVTFFTSDIFIYIDLLPMYIFFSFSLIFVLLIWVWLKIYFCAIICAAFLYFFLFCLGGIIFWSYSILRFFDLSWAELNALLLICFLIFLFCFFLRFSFLFLSNIKVDSILFEIIYSFFIDITQFLSNELLEKNSSKDLFNRLIHQQNYPNVQTFQIDELNRIPIEWNLI